MYQPPKYPYSYFPKVLGFYLRLHFPASIFFFVKYAQEKGMTELTLEKYMCMRLFLHVDVHGIILANELNFYWIFCTGPQQLNLKRFVKFYSE